MSFHAPLLTRSFNELTGQILSYKNKEAEGKIVVMYDYDERIALVREERDFSGGRATKR